MKPSTHLFLVVNCVGLASSLSITNADDSVHTIEKRACFKSGEKFGKDKATALDIARRACNNELKGTYHKRETRVRCYNLGNSKQVKLTVGLTGHNAGSTRTIGSDECFNGLSTEINCEKGGDTTYGNWRYRADPNKGAC